MKSMLHEASSIINAIEKAWTESGKPSEFTIKVLEEGEKGFLGFSKRPAIVSITFNAVRVSEKNKFKERDSQNRDVRNNRNVQNRDQQNRDLHGRDSQQKISKHDNASRQLDRNDKNQNSQDRNRFQVADSQELARRQQQSANSKLEQLKNEKKVVQNQGPLSPEESQVWVDDWVNFVSQGLTDLLKVLPFQVSFTTKVDKKVLAVIFDKPLMENEDENRAVSASISYILMQYLKRKYKKKFRGYQILVTIISAHELSKRN